MKVELSRKQYRELLINSSIGAYIRESLAEAEDEPDFQRVWDVVDYLATFAKDFRSEDMVVKTEKETYLSDDLMVKEVADRIDEYVEDEVWEFLMTRLAFRDLAQTLTPSEKLEIETGGDLPDRADLFFQKYRFEFEEHGLERLEIVEHQDR